jgi:hypothetical protein
MTARFLEGHVPKHLIPWAHYHVYTAEVTVLQYFARFSLLLAGVFQIQFRPSKSLEDD